MMGSRQPLPMRGKVPIELNRRLVPVATGAQTAADDTVAPDHWMAPAAAGVSLVLTYSGVAPVRAMVLVGSGKSGASQAIIVMTWPAASGMPAPPPRLDASDV